MTPESPAHAAPPWLTELAGKAARMTVPPLLRPPATGNGRPSAVLMLVGETAGQADLLIVQRSPWLRRHAGQPAFPGGAIEADDAGPVGAALREAAEEAGVDPAGVDVLVVLPDLHISRSGFTVTPVLAWWRQPAPVVPAADGEVTAAVRVGSPTSRIRRTGSGCGTRWAAPGRLSGCRGCSSGDSPQPWSTGCWRSVDSSGPGTPGRSRICRRRCSIPLPPVRPRSGRAAPGLPVWRTHPGQPDTVGRCPVICWI